MISLNSLPATVSSRAVLRSSSAKDPGRSHPSQTLDTPESWLLRGRATDHSKAAAAGERQAHQGAVSCKATEIEVFFRAKISTMKGDD